MSSDRIIITGAAQGGAANRREINDLVRDERQFSLYIQALDDIMSRPQSEFTSYFQVGGIHGLPYTIWDGATGPGGNPLRGYCTHGSTLFPTWHRPYVALFEQLLHESALRIASEYPGAMPGSGWMAAADSLRQPYWDWAANAVLPPEVISMDRVTITTPRGGGVSVPNPLRRYRFNPIDSSFSFPFNQWQTTLRRPTPSSAPNATDNVAELDSLLRNAQSNRTFTRSTYALLTQVRTWPGFSNHTPTEGGGANSVESIHDNIHVILGGNGHMATVSVAGFDPIFYLHHANVDRMLSLWAALNPGVWVTPGREGGTITIPPGSTVDVNTPLTPFWNTNTTFWPSSTVTGTTPLGYTYPEFNGLDMSNPTAVRLAIAAHVNRLYGDPIFGGFSSAFQSLAGEIKPGAHTGRAPEGHAQPEVATSPRSASTWEWCARVHFKHMELGSSFAVCVFLGAPPEDPKEWQTASTFVGAHHAFVNSAPEECANCQSHKEDVNEGFVHLNGALAAYSKLGSLEPDVVKPYLAKELQWRAQRADGTPVELETLEVVIVATPLKLQRGAPLPDVGEPVHHHDVTRGRRGGSK